MTAPITTYTNVDGLTRALRQVPKHANRELRDASGAIAGKLAEKAAARARGTSRLAALIAPTIRVRRDRVPAVVMGSAAKLPARNGKARTGKRQTVGDVIYGGEFGGRGRPTTQQFLPHRGTLGYFLYPVVRDEADETMRAYSEALDDALRLSK